MEKSVFKYRIEPNRVDFTGRISVSSMFDMILAAAGEDAHTRGFGVDALAVNDYGWVLSRICFELDALPKEYSDLTLYTWIGGYNRLISTRNFQLADAEGKEFGRAVSQWCMLDFNTRMPADMNTMAKAHEGNMVDAPEPCERPRRLLAVDSEVVGSHKVAYSDIDFNHHMNTMRYIDLIFDSMPIEVIENLQSVRMDINFVKEALYGDELSIYGNECDGVRQYEFRNAAGEVLCRAALEIK